MIVFQDFEIYQLADDMTDDEFYEFCVANKDLRIEREPDKKIIIMAPVGPESGFYEGKVFSKLDNWNEEVSPAGVTFSPSTGYKLLNGATRAADASWISLERWEKLTDDQKKKFLPIAPDFAVEIRSKTDKLKKLKSKMLEWIENGVRLAWLIDPVEQKTYIYRADGSIEILDGFERMLSGEEVLKGFEFDLRLLRLP
ncbi:MAG: Uma2 family endonuclease [Saprospiraceae bacterium]